MNLTLKFVRDCKYIIDSQQDYTKIFPDTVHLSDLAKFKRYI
jgi:hypothetical protein